MTDGANPPPVAEDMLTEYKTLRDEILQLYREQAQLAFVSTLPLLGSLVLGKRPENTNRWLLLAAALTLLSGIAFKIRGNYWRIFLMGSFLAVIHERRGKPPEAFKPGPECPAWHTRWRKIDNNPIYPELKGVIGRASAQGDAAFVGSIAVGIALLTVGGDLFADLVTVVAHLAEHCGELIDALRLASSPRLTPQALNGISSAAGVAVTTLIGGYLFSILRQLWNVQAHAGKYREELEHFIAAGEC